MQAFCVFCTIFHLRPRKDGTGIFPRRRKHGAPYSFFFVDLMNESRVSAVSWITFIALALTWGSSFILMKRGLVAFTALQVGMLRIVLAAGFILSVSASKLRSFNRANAVPLLVVGLVSIVFPYLLFPLAVSRIDSGLVAVLNAMVPLFTLLIGVIWFKTRVSRMAVAGILVGLGGALWLLLPGMQFQIDQMAYGMLPILAGVGYAVGVNTVNRYLRDMESIDITVITLAIALVPALVMLAMSGVWNAFDQSPHAWASLGYVAVLGILGTAVANLFFNTLIRTTGSLFSSSVTYVIPIVALGWGLYDGERIGMDELLGMAAILLGVWMVNQRRRPSTGGSADVAPVEGVALDGEAMLEEAVGRAASTSTEMRREGAA